MHDFRDKRRYWSKIAIFSIPYAFDAPVRWGHRRNIAIPFGSGATKGGGAGGCSSTPQPKLGPSCNSSRSDDFLYGVGGVRTPTAFTNTSECAYCLYVFQDVEMAHMEEHKPNESLEMISAVLVQLTLTKILKIVATRWRILRLKMHHNRFRLGLRPRPR